MSNRMNPESMVDVDLSRAWDGATIGITIYNGEDDDLDNMLAQGYTIDRIVTVL